MCIQNALSDILFRLEKKLLNQSRRGFLESVVAATGAVTLADLLRSGRATAGIVQAMSPSGFGEVTFYLPELKDGVLTGYDLMDQIVRLESLDGSDSWEVSTDEHGRAYFGGIPTAVESLPELSDMLLWKNKPFPSVLNPQEGHDFSFSFYNPRGGSVRVALYDKLGRTINHLNIAPKLARKNLEEEQVDLLLKPTFSQLKQAVNEKLRK